MPNAAMIGMFRDEHRLSPVSYYDKLSMDIAAGPVLLLDPMLATGGSALAAIALLRSRGCRDIRFVCIVASPGGYRTPLDPGAARPRLCRRHRSRIG